MRVVRELTENRSKLAYARTNLAERLAELQHEYMRLMRVADLSRVVSKENVAKAAKATRSLKQVRLVRPCAYTQCLYVHSLQAPAGLLHNALKGYAHLTCSCVTGITQTCSI